MTFHIIFCLTLAGENTLDVQDGCTEIHTSFYCVVPLRSLLGEHNNYCTKVGRPGNMATWRVTQLYICWLTLYKGNNILRERSTSCIVYIFKEKGKLK